ncbi:MAG: CDF family Co(II)/Ni(II) efflux transporter DmeF [Kiritimatiellae bacterium]|nr:CDF family Co(II)/Ni(II) efflux transporter DmeF [Kiritimatiellia bacterium]
MKNTARCHTSDIVPWLHTHEFVTVDSGNERRIIIVAVVTAVTMAVEITAGFIFGSMALLADGWHMGTHMAALGISVFAYRYARHHARDLRFTFGTGKVGVLGGFASAVVLAVVAFIMAAESGQRFFKMPVIYFDQAIIVAAAGLLVNLLSAVLLRSGSAHGHIAGADHGHVHDHNLRAAYFHVLADALTSVLAIIALALAKVLGYLWLDPLMGLVGSALIVRWSYGLLRDTGHILVDAAVEQNLLKCMREAIESGNTDRVCDLHVWNVGPSNYAAIVSVVSDHPKPIEHYKALLAGVKGLSHISVEVNECRAGMLAPGHVAIL